MQIAVVATKLTPPPSRGATFVARPRLLELLTQGSHAGTTLVSAPAGFGKTTLVADYVRSVDAPAAWLSLDAGDNDPARFLAALLAALRNADPGIGVTAQAMLDSVPSPPAEALLTSLLNDVTALARPANLVLDDYHVIDLPPIHALVGFLLEHRPARMHIVLVTREDPPLPLARLRARAALIEVRQADLSFTVEEVAEFLRRNLTTRLTHAEISALHDRSEGWVAGLQLAVLSSRSSADMQRLIASVTGTNRFILDYLTEEVLARQSPEVRTFLLQTSLLDRLCAPLCEAILGRDGESPAGSSPPTLPHDGTPAQNLLEYLDRANLFVIPLDTERQWYRYHHLFAELLQSCLRREQAGRVNTLHSRASRWYADHGFVAEAIRHALAGEDWAQAANLIKREAQPMVQCGELLTLMGWLAALPPAVIQASAQLCLAYAWPLLLTGRLDAAGQWLVRARELAEGEDHPPGSDPRSLLGEVIAAESNLARAQGDLRQSAELAHRALTLLPENADALRAMLGVTLGLTYWYGGHIDQAEPVLQAAATSARRCGNDFARLTAQTFLGRSKAMRGELHAAAALFQDVVDESLPVPVTILAHVDLAYLSYEWNDLDVAESHMRAGQTLAEPIGDAEYRLSVSLILARLRSARGDLRGALQVVDQVDQLLRASESPASLWAHVAATGVVVALAGAALHEAEHWAARMSREAGGHPFYRHLNLAWPRLLLARGERRAASEALHLAYDTASQAGWEWGIIATRVWQAAAAETQQAGLTFLKDALHRGASERFIRTFADTGPTLVPLLREAARQGVAPAEYVGHILQAIAEQAGSRSPNPTPSLSTRELQVLRLMAAGLSNRAIAENLVLSEGTVKKHIHNISGKLAAANRTEAVAHARKLGLL